MTFYIIDKHKVVNDCVVEEKQFLMKCVVCISSKVIQNNIFLEPIFATNN